MNIEILKRVYAVLKAREMRPKKLKIVKHLSNGSMMMDGRKISKAKLLLMQKDRKIKLVEVGRKYKKPSLNNTI